MDGGRVDGGRSGERMVKGAWWMGEVVPHVHGSIEVNVTRVGCDHWLSDSSLVVGWMGGVGWVSEH